MKAWVINELKGLEIGDQRLNVRCGNILNDLSISPDKSIPEALETWSETKAAYRFLVIAQSRIGMVQRLMH